MNTDKSMKNIADIVHWIETEKPFTPAFQKKVLGSVRKMQKLPQYGVPLEQIPADLDAFNKLWGRGPIRTLPNGFTKKSSYSAWRSQVRSALTAFFDVPKPIITTDEDDHWSQLLSDLRGADVHPKRLISVTVLAGIARKAKLSPAEVSHSWLQEIVDTAEASGRYEAIKAARSLIHKHASSLTVTISPAFSIPLRKSTQHCVRHPLPDQLAADIEVWRQTFTQGVPKGNRKKRRGGHSAERTNAVLRGVTYVHTAMVTAGLLPSDGTYSVRDMIDPDHLGDIIERELMGEFPWKKLRPTTQFEYLNNWRLFVRSCGLNAEPLAEVVGEFSEFENVKTMSTTRREWCESFLFDMHKQAAFLSLPNKLFSEAKKAMVTYESGTRYEKDSAIALGIAACAAAIWTSLPLRISTLLRLSYGGEHADVQIHSSRKGLIITTPAEIVKNGYSHRNIVLSPKPGGNPHEIVSWFVKEVRPRLLIHHISPHLRQSSLLFGGVSYARLSSIWRSVTLEAGVPMTPHQVRHAIATIMANQPGADYGIIAALLGDTEETVRKNYVVIDRAKKTAEGQKILAQIQRNTLMKGVV
jgi:hypothetical protein